MKGSSGDGTVPVSSGAALNVLESADVTKDDESYLVRDHEPIFKTKTELDTAAEVHASAFHVFSRILCSAMFSMALNTMSSAVLVLKIGS